MLAHDNIVFFGDLNYRIDGATDAAVLEIVKRGDHLTLACRDHEQLLREKAAGR